VLMPGHVALHVAAGLRGLVEIRDDGCNCFPPNEIVICGSGCVACVVCEVSRGLLCGACTYVVMSWRLGLFV